MREKIVLTEVEYMLHAVNIKIIAESSTLYITERRATASASCCLNAFLRELTLWSKHKRTHCSHHQCQNRLLYCHYSHHGLITSKISFFPSYSLGASAMSVRAHVCVCVEIHALHKWWPFPRLPGLWGIQRIIPCLRCFVSAC